MSKLNATLLKEAANNPFSAVFFTPQEQIDAFLESINIPVNEEKGEKPIGKLSPLQAAYFMKAAQLQKEAEEKAEAFNAQDKKARASGLDKSNAEVQTMLKQASILKKIGWEMVRAELLKTNVDPDTVGYRKDGILVSIPERGGIIIIGSPFGGLFDGMLGFKL